MGVLLQGRRNSKALAMELRLSCTNPSIYSDAYVRLQTKSREDYKVSDKTT